MSDAATPVAVAVDVVVLTIREGHLSAVVRPLGGQWALLGGWLRPDELLDVAARRQLSTWAGLVGRPLGIHLEQLRTYDTSKRGRISVAYLSLLPSPASPASPVHVSHDVPQDHFTLGDAARRDDVSHDTPPDDAWPKPKPDDPTAPNDLRTARWVPVACFSPPAADSNEPAVTPALQLAFDHVPILADGVERARAKLEYSSLATAFCAEPFTLADLRRVYEAVWGVRLDVPNFRRKVLSTPGLVEPLGCRASPASGGRPAELYRRGAATVLHPAMLRP